MQELLKKCLTFTKNIYPHFLTVLIYHLQEKWEFVYLSLDSSTSLPKIPKDDNLDFEILKTDDFDEFKSSFEDYLSNDQIQDLFLTVEKKIYINSNLLIARKNNQILNFLEIFDNIHNSPLKKTPFNLKLAESSDAYIGFTYTKPKARSLWLAPQLLIHGIGILRKLNPM